MATINLNAYYDSSDGKYKSRYEIGSKLEVVGSVAHGGTMTVRTNGFYNFGARTNTKPLYVNLGFKAGSVLGRLTSDYFHSSGVEQSSVKPGSIASAVRLDFKYLATISAPEIFGDVDFNPAKPLIQYIERYYAFDIRDPNVWGANGAGTGIAGFNLKTNRLYYDLDGAANNSYIGYQGKDALSARAFTERVEVSADSYSADLPTANTWGSEEFLFLNSSALNVEDGELRHYRSNTFLNPSAYLRKTIDATYPNQIYTAYLDQNSNGCGDGVANVYVYASYQCWDDEYNGVYVGNNAARGSCTKLVRLPQSSWSQTAADFTQIYSVVDSTERYFYVRTGKTSWLSDTGIR